MHVGFLHLQADPCSHTMTFICGSLLRLPTDRISACTIFSAHLTGEDGNGNPYKTAAVVVDPKHIATYAHQDHAATLTMGATIQVNQR